MEVRVRNVNLVAVKKIDEMAKEKKMSRNEFLRRQFHDLAVMPELKVEKDRLALTVNKLIDGLETQNKQMEKINDRLKLLTNLIIVATGMPDDEVKLILSDGDKLAY